MNSLAILDWFVIAVYLLLMLGIGWYYNSKNVTKDDYLLGGRRLSPLAAGISLFATLLSTLSYLSYPGEMTKHGPAIFIGMLAFPLVYFVAGWWLIPKIRQANVTSAYEILEHRLGVKVRVLATWMFLFLRFFWMATIVYVTVNIALRTVAPFAVDYVGMISAIIILFTIVYTVLGGLKAVVVTDVVQACIFLGGALISILVVVYHIGSFGALFPAEWPDHWSSPKIGFDLHERSTFGNALLMVFVWYIATIGSDQMAIQRYIGTRDIKDARKSLGVSMFTGFISETLLGFVGLAMLAYFTLYPSLLEERIEIGKQADKLFPRFILVGLPQGLSGLLIAGLLAAAMSSLSSGLNAVSSVIAEDVIGRFRKRKVKDGLMLAKKLTLLSGAIVLILSFLIGYVPGNLYDVIMKVVNLLVCPLFVLFFLALFVPIATEWGTVIGGLTAICIAVAVAYFQVFGITVLWISPTALGAGILMGIIASIIERLISNTRSNS